MKHTLVIAVFLACAAAIDDTQAGGALSSKSRDLLYAYFDHPDVQTIREQQARSGLEVEICGDECDLFVLPDEKNALVMWDLIMLYEVFLSPTSAYDDFRAQHAQYSRDLLGRYSAGRCSKHSDEKKRATCSVASMAKRIGLKYAFVRYDEGARCKAFKSFDDLSKVIGGDVSPTEPERWGHVLNRASPAAPCP